MPLLNSVVQWLNFKRIYQIQLYNEHPHEIQNEVLFSLLNSAKETEWGIAHDYDKIASHQDFQKAVPVAGIRMILNHLWNDCVKAKKICFGREK